MPEGALNKRQDHAGYGLPVLPALTAAIIRHRMPPVDRSGEGCRSGYQLMICPGVAAGSGLRVCGDDCGYGHSSATVEEPGFKPGPIGSWGSTSWHSGWVQCSGEETALSPEADLGLYGASCSHQLHGSVYGCGRLASGGNGSSRCSGEIVAAAPTSRRRFENFLGR
jgi:hypothetical protein